MASLRYITAIPILAGAVFMAYIVNSGAETVSVQQYYTSLESRLGYYLFLNNARHCGYWPKGTVWPFPITRAQRVMEDKLYSRLALPNNTKVLDAGAGSGIVALRMAKNGLIVDGVELVPAHVEEAWRNIRRDGMEDKVSIKLGDYHNLSGFADGSMDGVYTMETFVHADNASKVLQEFFRVLKPNGVLVLHEAEYVTDSDLLRQVLRLAHCQNMLKQGSYVSILHETGFRQISVEDLSENVLPLWRLFGWVGSVPYEILKSFGYENRFTNLMAGVESYRHWEDGRYISIRAVKAG